MNKIGQKNAERRTHYTEPRDQEEKPGAGYGACDRRMQKVQTRPLHHDYGFAQCDKSVDSTRERDDAEPNAALPKRWTVDKQYRAARERHHCYERQQDPKHPLSEPSVRRGRSFVIARRSHTGHHRRENGVESLIHFSQAVRGADDCTVNTNRSKRHTGRASDEVAKHEKVQPGNERVNQLVNADGSRIRD